MAAGNLDGVGVWHVGPKQDAAAFNPARGQGNSLVFLPDGKALAHGSYGRLRVIQAPGGTELRQFEKLEFVSPECLALSPDGKTLVSGGNDPILHAWDVASGNECGRFEGHERYVNAVQFSPDGKWLASADGDGIILLRDAATRRKLRQLEGSEKSVASLAFTPDGQCLVSAGDDGVIRLWDPATGKELRQLAGHRGRVRTLAISPDGRRLASGSTDSTVLLWDLDAARQRGRGGP